MLTLPPRATRTTHSALHDALPILTAAALVSENKQRAYPASVDSIPTSANQEDHVSMAAHGARRLLDMADNASVVIGIELLAACQGIDFHAPLKSSDAIEAAHKHLRAAVPMLEDDRHFHPDMEIGRAHVCTPVTNAHLVCRLLLDKKKNI